MYITRMILKSNLLEPRYVYDSSWSGSGGARWAFFAIFVVLIFIVILGTLRVNKRRTRQGIQPLYGTRWMTPPSYIQSQNQYNQPSNTRDPNMPSNYVPTYSETTNEYDMGFYDNNGNFHPNPNAKTFIPRENDPQYPQPVHHREESTGTDGVTVSRSIPDYENNQTIREEDEDDIANLYRPPPGPPSAGNAQRTASHDSNAANVPSSSASNEFSAPPRSRATGSSESSTLSSEANTKDSNLHI